MGIPEDLKNVAIQRISMESERTRLKSEWAEIKNVGSWGTSVQQGAYNAMQEYRKTGIHPSKRVQAKLDRIKEIGVLLEASQVREQGLVDKWNAQKIRLANETLQKQLSLEQAGLKREQKREQKKAQASGGHPEYGLGGGTYRPPPRRAKSGVRSRYAATKRRSTPRPKYRPPPRSRR